MSVPNFMRAANDGLSFVNDSATDADVQWSPQQASSLKWIFPQPETAPSPKMTDLTRQEMTAALAANKAEVDARLANFDTSIKTGFAELATAMAKQSAAMEKQTDALRVEMAKQSGDVRSEMAAIRAEMHKGTADLLKWGATIAFAAVASTVGMLTYLNKTTEKPAAQAATQQQAPTIIAVPAGSTVLSAPQAPAATAPPPAKQSN